MVLTAFLGLGLLSTGLPAAQHVLHGTTSLSGSYGTR
jgi:hypothetical protein